MERQLAAKKSLGQNFLKSKKAISQMIDAVHLKEGDLVVEVGPGKGALTGPILERGARVLAFELDERMIEHLTEKFAPEIARGQLKLIHADILEVNFNDYFKQDGEYVLIANIPYYITNAIIRKFLEAPIQPREISLLMQKEVAERIVARDGKQSLLSLSVAVFGEPKYVAKVSRVYFSPQPRVDSAILHISSIHRKLGLAKEYENFFALIHAGFVHKRKRLMKNLQNHFSQDTLVQAFQSMNLDENIRAEELCLNDWIELCRKLSS